MGTQEACTGTYCGCYGTQQACTRFNQASRARRSGPPCQQETSMVTAWSRHGHGMVTCNRPAGLLASRGPAGKGRSGLWPDE